MIVDQFPMDVTSIDAIIELDYVTSMKNKILGSNGRILGRDLQAQFLRDCFSIYLLQLIIENLVFI